MYPDSPRPYRLSMLFSIDKGRIIPQALVSFSRQFTGNLTLNTLENYLEFCFVFTSVSNSANGSLCLESSQHNHFIRLFCI